MKCDNFPRIAGNDQNQCPKNMDLKCYIIWNVAHIMGLMTGAHLVISSCFTLSKRLKNIGKVSSLLSKL